MLPSRIRKLPYEFLCFTLLCGYVFAQSTACGKPAILSALTANSVNGSNFFCSDLLESVSLVGTLGEEDVYVVTVTETNRKSVDTVYVYATTTTKEIVTTTIIAPQGRTSKDFTQPLPTYVEQYGTAAVSKACSCYIGPGPTYTQYRECPPATSTSVTITITVGKPGAKTSTITDISTKTKYKSTTIPYPNTCPGADRVDYIASDQSAWDRGCQTYLECYHPIDTVKAPSINACIEKCVDYNKALGYKQCQAIIYDPKSNDCIRGNDPCFWGHYPGSLNAATLRFSTPSATETNFCSTVSGAEVCTTTPQLFCSTR